MRGTALTSNSVNKSEDAMDRGAALLVALRTIASLGDGKVEAVQLESLATTLGIQANELPAIVTRWETAGNVKIGWGSVLTVVPQAASSASVIINAQGASFGPGSAIGGTSAVGGTVNITPETAFGVLAAAVAGLQGLQPTLDGHTASVAEEVTQLLKDPPKVEAPVEVRRAWALNAAKSCGRLLELAPQAKALVDLGHMALNGLGWA